MDSSEDRLTAEVSKLLSRVRCLEKNLDEAGDRWCQFQNADSDHTKFSGSLQKIKRNLFTRITKLEQECFLKYFRDKVKVIPLRKDNSVATMNKMMSELEQNWTKHFDIPLYVYKGNQSRVVAPTAKIDSPPAASCKNSNYQALAPNNAQSKVETDLRKKLSKLEHAKICSEVDEKLKKLKMKKECKRCQTQMIKVTYETHRLMCKEDGWPRIDRKPCTEEKLQKLRDAKIQYVLERMNSKKLRPRWIIKTKQENTDFLPCPNLNCLASLKPKKLDRHLRRCNYPASTKELRKFLAYKPSITSASFKCTANTSYPATTEITAIVSSNCQTIISEPEETKGPRIRREVIKSISRFQRSPA